MDNRTTHTASSTPSTTPSRRTLLRTTAAASALAVLPHHLLAQTTQQNTTQPSYKWPMSTSGNDPVHNPANLQFLPPRNRKPVSLIIDDSTALVNLAHFGIPHFHQALPDRYPQDWRSLPREIPDSFVNTFADYCEAHGVRGKYSVVPYPACVGWIDRDMPGWSRAQLTASLKLIRDRLTTNWDIHPEMISHTWAIDITTGRPFPQTDADHMENFGFSQNLSADQLASYIAYALRILRNVDLPCQGITTPGGFASQNLENLSTATFQAVRDIYNAPLPHYFRHLFTDNRSVAPRIEPAAPPSTTDPNKVVSIIGCTGDWFGGWDGLEPGSPDPFITPDLTTGRMIDVIENGEPAVMVCHWPGIYYNGQYHGFNVFKTVVDRLERRYPNQLIWMKLSEIAHYAAAAQHHAQWSDPNTLDMQNVPFPANRFTLVFELTQNQNPTRIIHKHRSTETPLQPTTHPDSLDSNTYLRTNNRITACFNIKPGRNQLLLK